MSQTGIRGFYLLTETIKDQLLGDVNVNTVTTGDIFDIDLAKQSIFPLSHIIINNVTTQEQVLTFKFSKLFKNFKFLKILTPQKCENSKIFKNFYEY